jgi:diadenosine tetraphosphatase ApaH/serine/threonine PP2A family protein phosphatase
MKPDAVILGNTDRYLLEEPWKDPARVNELSEALAWTRARLSEESLAWMAALPRSFSETIDGCDVELAHGAPGDDEFRIEAGVDRERLEALFASHGPGVTFCGHTHKPYRAKVRGREILVAGSIGYPFDGDSRAAYMRVTVAAGALRDYENRRVAYNVDSSALALRSLGMPLAETFVRRLWRAELDV